MMMGSGGNVLEGMLMGVIATLPLQLTPIVAISGDLVASTNTNNSGVTSNNNIKKDDRIPQWGYHDIKEFIAIKANLEKDFTQKKRNKTLWELITPRMKEKGFYRSSKQCKCKCKNLVNQYKIRGSGWNFSSTLGMLKSSFIPYMLELHKKKKTPKEFNVNKIPFSNPWLRKGIISIQQMQDYLVVNEIRLEVHKVEPFD
eukprot:Gb_36510 [translate_table: standard]